MTGARHLFAPLVLRPARKDRLRFALTISGIAVGVATMTAIRLANASVLSSFAETVDVVAGRASITILPDGPGIPESVLGRLAWLARVPARVVPAVTETAAAGAADGEAVEVLGIDPVSDPEARDYAFAGRSAGGLFAIFGKDSVLVTEEFARRKGLSPGDVLPLVAGGVERRLRVAAVLAPRGPARAASGSIVFMDIAAAQEAFGKIGRLDRIDVVLPEGTPEERRAAIEEEIRASLPPGVTAGRPERRTETVDRMVRAFRVNLTALGLIALLVGVYFVYNTLSISVLRRRTDIGTVRALGASARAVLAVFLAEGAALGITGSALGLLLGILLARVALLAVGGTATELYLPSAHPRLGLDAGVLATAFGLGVASSILSALAPALEAARVAPAATLRHGSVEAARRRATRPLALVGTGLLVLAFLATRPGPVGGLPLFGFVSVFLVVAGVSLLAPAAVTFTAARLDGIAVRLFGVTARIARANLTGSLSRTAVAVAALTMGIGMMVSVAVMVGSFRVDRRALGGADPQGRPLRHPRERTVGAVVRAPPRRGDRPRRVGRRRGRRRPLPRLRGDARRRPVHRRLRPVRGPRGARTPSPSRRTRRRTRRARGEGAWTRRSSRSRTRRSSGSRRGDVVEIPSTAAPSVSASPAVYVDYSNDRGTITIDRDLFRKIYGLSGAVSLAVTLDPAARPRGGAKAPPRGGGGPFRPPRPDERRAPKRDVLRIFDRTFAVTYALEGVAIAVAVLGVFNTLTALVLERRREIGLLRVLGASADTRPPRRPLRGARDRRARERPRPRRGRDVARPRPRHQPAVVRLDDLRSAGPSAFSPRRSPSSSRRPSLPPRAPPASRRRRMPRRR